MKISKHINSGILHVIAKPNAPKTEVIGWDESRKALRIAVAAVPDKDKANTELLKFLKKQTGKRCELISGARSREKTIRFV
ncbi:MAG: YggU family protein [Nanoarchaeota archaeon]|nr:YggU family protein [Nanoarchaeota archaeon]